MSLDFNDNRVKCSECEEVMIGPYRMDYSEQQYHLTKGCVEAMTNLGITKEESLPYPDGEIDSIKKAIVLLAVHASNEIGTDVVNDILVLLGGNRVGNDR